MFKIYFILDGRMDTINCRNLTEVKNLCEEIVSINGQIVSVRDHNGEKITISSLDFSF